MGQRVNLMMQKMNDSEIKKGSVAEFDENWRELADSSPYHFKRGDPDHQIQFAFQNHWRVFKNVMKGIPSGKALEVGCGRGSMGAFFAEAGLETTLLDTSPSALQIARANFQNDNLEAEYICGDALELPFDDDQFDVIVSIGLLEHFEDIETAVKEQVRVIKKGGYFLGYVVPERSISVQKLGSPVNFILKLFQTGLFGKKGHLPLKFPIYRNEYASQNYLNILDGLNVTESGAFGMFPVPLISHSVNFPFSIMEPSSERRLVWLWRFLLGLRRGTDPWICSEKWGLAFLVWAKK
jgi:ubiquinone/menaquinone biosynthesis C-methylase UbiE